MPRLFQSLAIATTRHRLRVEARKRGYSRSQAKRLVADVSDSTILDKLKAFWAKWGPTIMAILQVVLAILPLLMAKEPPEGPPLTTQAEIEAAELEEATGEDNLGCYHLPDGDLE